MARRLDLTAHDRFVGDERRRTFWRAKYQTGEERGGEEEGEQRTGGGRGHGRNGRLAFATS